MYNVKEWILRDCLYGWMNKRLIAYIEWKTKTKAEIGT